MFRVRCEDEDGNVIVVHDDSDGSSARYAAQDSGGNVDGTPAIGINWQGKKVVQTGFDPDAAKLLRPDGKTWAGQIVVACVRQPADPNPLMVAPYAWPAKVKYNLQ